MTNPITIGGDPEVFVRDVSSKAIESSIGILRGTKRKPFKTEHGYVHKDNVLAEMNIKPAKSLTQWVDNVQGIMGDLEKLLGDHGKEMAIISSNIMDLKYLEHYEAAHFGCNKNENCWDLLNPIKPNAEDAGQLRTASGHIHIGFPFTDMNDQLSAVRACELFIGVGSVAMDGDARRRTLYGKAGSFRPKPYGIEYTVPSNFWLTSEMRMEWIYTAAVLAVKKRKSYSGFILDHKDEIQQTINTCDKTSADKLLRAVGVSLKEYS